MPAASLSKTRKPGEAPSTSKRRMQPLALPDKPSIAVLPFTNMSGNPDQGYLSDGITEDIITELSRFRSLFVIARNSSFAYRGESVDVRRIGRELGVRFVVEVASAAPATAASPTDRGRYRQPPLGGPMTATSATCSRSGRVGAEHASTLAVGSRMRRYAPRRASRRQPAGL
jgi:hypothetical protein